MVEVSKFMLDHHHELSYLPCSKLIHPWTDSCTEALKTMLIKCSIGSIKFYTSIQAALFVSLVIKIILT